MPVIKQHHTTVVRMGAGDIAICAAKVEGIPFSTEVLFIPAHSGHKPNEVVNQEYAEKHLRMKSLDDADVPVRLSFGCTDSIDALIEVLSELKEAYGE